MDFPRAKDLLAELVAQTPGVEFVEMPGFAEETAAIKYPSYEGDYEVFRYIHLEPNGDFSIISQLRTQELDTHLIQSKKFGKFIQKRNRTLLRQGTGVELLENRLGMMAALNRTLTTQSLLVSQELLIRMELHSIIAELELKFKKREGEIWATEL